MAYNFFATPMQPASPRYANGEDARRHCLLDFSRAARISSQRAIEEKVALRAPRRKRRQPPSPLMTIRHYILTLIIAEQEAISFIEEREQLVARPHSGAALRFMYERAAYGALWRRQHRRESRAQHAPPA